MDRFTYKQASDLLELPERTIRYWITEGLIPPPHLSEGKRKYFTRNQIEDMEALKWFLKDNGQTIADIRAVRKIVIDNLEGCEAAGHPLRQLKEAIFGGVCAYTKELLKFLIDDFLKRKLWFEVSSDGRAMLRGDFLRFKSDFQGYRYGQKLEVVEIPEDYFEENRCDFVRFDELGTDHESEAKNDVGRTEVLIREGLLDPPHYRRQGVLYLLADEFGLADSWKSLAHQAGFETLRDLRAYIEADIHRQFPYDLTASSYRSLCPSMLPEIRQFYMEIDLVKRVLDALIKYRIQDNRAIELYLNGLLSIHHKACSTCLSFEVFLAKTSLSDLAAAQLKSAEKFGLYNAKEVGTEADWRINQNRKEIDFLRYRVLKNLSRRKK